MINPFEHTEPIDTAYEGPICADCDSNPVEFTELGAELCSQCHDDALVCGHFNGVEYSLPPEWEGEDLTRRVNS